MANPTTPYNNTDLLQIWQKLADIAANSASFAVLDYGTSTTAQRTAAQIGNATGPADFGSGAYSNQTLRVVLPTDQPAITVNSVTTSRERFRRDDVTTSAFAVKVTAGNLLGWNIKNKHTAAIYVKFYDEAVADVDPDLDAPILTLEVPANGSVWQEPNCIQEIFTTAITIRVTTGIADNDATAAGTLPLIELQYSA